MESFKKFLEGYPGTKDNPPDNIPWVSPETRVWKRPSAHPIPKKPARLPIEKGLNRLPPHLKNDPDVIASTLQSSTRRNPKTGRIRDSD
jgi:hypothetical protein